MRPRGTDDWQDKDVSIWSDWDWMCYALDKDDWREAARNA